MLLIAPFSGCRLEELGKLRPGNIRTEGGVHFIAIERVPGASVGRVRWGTEHRARGGGYRLHWH